MPGNVFVNEVRISLDELRNLDILQYRLSNLSTGHKKHLEHLLATQQRCVSIFEGDVLFCLKTEAVDIKQTKKSLLDFLTQHVQNSEKGTIKIIKLGQAPERVIERLTFALISFRSANRGIFNIYGRILFKPTNREGRQAHFAVETTTVIEDGFLKIYLTPSFIALVNIQNTAREERNDLELVNLCKFRVGCNVAKVDGSCPYVYPGQLGYYLEEKPLDNLSQKGQESFQKAYEGCPQISNVQTVILAKASKKAKNTRVYPPYTVHARFSREDLQTEVEIARQYRNATLMWPHDRWRHTNYWVTECFGPNNKLEIGNIEIPIEIKLQQAYPTNGVSRDLGYKAIWMPEQQIVNDEQNPRAQSQSGGWLFADRGAYDREDTKRPFEKVHPYLIVPDTKNIIDLSRELLTVFSDGEYTARKRGDQQFIGLNRPENLRKYNSRFVNIWDEEEGIFLVDGSEADYIT